MVKTKKNKFDVSGESGISDCKADDECETSAETVEPISDPMKNLEEKLKNSELESKQAYDRFLRVSADFENYKKRTAREMSEFRKYANESLISEMLSVVDNLERAIISSTVNDKVNNCLVEGVDMTLKEILKVLENYGVKPIESLCKTFDPNFHQAVMQQESEEHTENTVIAELQKGYMIHDRLLRPSMVIVSATKGKFENNTKENNI
ncbi:MAG: nucleotide exchange factor GrpE [Desulfobacteraceae bacterium A6]|nr:MAG: nucleotide exchange factor GrpE [Desulfobacteraceae bacterium A6]